MPPDHITLEKYFDIRLDYLEKIHNAYIRTLDKRLEGLNNYITRPEHDLLAKDIQDLKESRAETRGKASQTSVNIAYAMATLGIVISLFELILRFAK